MKRAEKEKTRAKKESDVRISISNLKAEIKALENDRTQNENAANGKDANEALVQKFEALQKTVSEEQQKQTAVSEENSKRMAEYLSQKASYDGKVREIEKQRDIFADKRTAIERDIANARNDIKLHERDAAEFNDTCPTCGQKLPTDKIAELTAKRENAEQAIKLIENSIEELRDMAKYEEKNRDLIQQVQKCMAESDSVDQDTIWAVISYLTTSADQMKLYKYLR